MTEFDREEAAFRNALALHADDGEQAPFRARHRHWRAPLLIAVTVLAVVGAAVGIAGTKGHKTEPSPSNGTGLENAQWIGIRNIEVKAPADWAPKYEPGRPDCIMKATDDPAEPAREKRGYVVIGDPGFGITFQRCMRPKAADDPAPAFGELPFPLWRPYVKVVAVRPGQQGATYRDGTWEFRDWRLTRKTIDEVQVSVLSAPGDDGLGSAVLDSVRRVRVNHLGCPAESSVLNHPDVDGRPLPAADAVSSVVICEYRRYSLHAQGLGGSRTMPTGAARELVAAIKAAPAGSGPNRPANCRHGQHGRPAQAQRALVLRFLGLDGQAITGAYAYAYYDSCVGNGIFTASGTHRLTRGNCSPLFTEPPIALPAAQRAVSDACFARDMADSFFPSTDELD